MTAVARSCTSASRCHCRQALCRNTTPVFYAFRTGTTSAPSACCLEERNPAPRKLPDGAAQVRSCAGTSERHIAHWLCPAPIESVQTISWFHLHFDQRSVDFAQCRPIAYCSRCSSWQRRWWCLGAGPSCLGDTSQSYTGYFPWAFHSYPTSCQFSCTLWISLSSPGRTLFGILSSTFEFAFLAPQVWPCLNQWASATLHFLRPVAWIGSEPFHWVCLGPGITAPAAAMKNWTPGRISWGSGWSLLSLASHPWMFPFTFAVREWGSGSLTRYSSLFPSRLWLLEILSWASRAHSPSNTLLCPESNGPPWPRLVHPGFSRESYLWREQLDGASW